MGNVYKTDNGYKAVVYDHGLVTLCEYKDGKWQDCVFETEAEAQEAHDRYVEFWNR